MLADLSRTKQLLVMMLSTLARLYYYNFREGENTLPPIVWEWHC